jgi:hypothetical protein
MADSTQRKTRVGHHNNEQGESTFEETKEPVAATSVEQLGVAMSEMIIT